MFPSLGNGVDANKFDPNVSQWMREAMESRQIIGELKAQNDKLQRDVYALNSKVTLIYECCADLGITDRVGDLIQKKLHGFQAAQVAQQLQGQSLAMASPRTKKPSLLDPKVVDEGFICGSSAFQELAGYSSSYEGQISRDSFHRKNRFEAEEAKFRDQFDIFGNPKKLPSPKSQQDAGAITRSGDMIDKLLLGSEGKVATLGSPLRLEETLPRQVGSGPIGQPSTRSFATNFH